jgi:hypothetical protein
VLLIKYAVDGKFLPVVGTGSNSSGKYQILGFAKTSLRSHAGKRDFMRAWRRRRGLKVVRPAVHGLKKRNPPRDRSPTPQTAAICTRLQPPIRHDPFFSLIAPKHASPARVGVPTCTRLSLGSSPIAAPTEAATAPAGTTHAGQTIRSAGLGDGVDVDVDVRLLEDDCCSSSAMISLMFSRLSRPSILSICYATEPSRWL